MAPTVDDQSGPQLKTKSSKASKDSWREYNQEYRGACRAYGESWRRARNGHVDNRLQEHLEQYPMAGRIALRIMLLFWAMPLLLVTGVYFVVYSAPREWLRNRRTESRVKRGKSVAPEDYQHLSAVDKSVLDAQNAQSADPATRSASTATVFRGRRRRSSVESSTNSRESWYSSLFRTTSVASQHSTSRDSVKHARTPAPRAPVRRRSGPIVDERGRELPPPQISLAAWQAQNRMALDNLTTRPTRIRAGSDDRPTRPTRIRAGSDDHI